MSVEAVTALSAALPLSSATNTLSSPNVAAAEGTFDALVRSLQNINAQMSVNKQAIESLAVGQGDELHRVIMNMESTKLAFDLALQVRNKVLDAYQELMRMQV